MLPSFKLSMGFNGRSKLCRRVDAGVVVGVAQQRKLRIASIFQHYYPEGGWGFVVLTCGALAQALAHGTQLASGVLGAAAQRRWRDEGGVDQRSVGKSWQDVHDFIQCIRCSISSVDVFISEEIRRV